MYNFHHHSTSTIEVCGISLDVECTTFIIIYHNFDSAAGDSEAAWLWNVQLHYNSSSIADGLEDILGVECTIVSLFHFHFWRL